MAHRPNRGWLRHFSVYTEEETTAAPVRKSPLLLSLIRYGYQRKEELQLSNRLHIVQKDLNY